MLYTLGIQKHIENLFYGIQNTNKSIFCFQIILPHWIGDSGISNQNVHDSSASFYMVSLCKSEYLIWKQKR